MKEKTRKILIMAVMAALIISLMAASLCYAFTYGRYTGGRFDEDSRYDDLIDFVGATAFEISTPDEFVNAVENGYSYIKISEGAEKPFVINNDIADVYTNLVLDVNGTTVIRNSRNPVLDVRRSISVVLVYDSSVEGSGGFYNPVGSALQTSGGSLTVGSGSYESGPKVKGSSSFSSDTSVTLYTRTSRTAGSYETKVEDTSMPSLSGDVYYTGDTTQYTYIENDTYLLYTEVKNAFVGKGETSDDATFESGQLYVNCKEFTTDGTQTTYSADIFAPDSNVASCDFYYYYPIDESGAYSSTAGTVDSPKTYAVVYGYNDVKGLAEDEDDNNDGIGEATALIDDGLVWPYAAIRSVEDGEVGGVTHARGGAFKTHFGKENTYCIYSAGGTMTVGAAGSAGGPSFEAVGSGVCIAMTGASGNVSEGGSLTISGGTFSSRLGNTIEMENGNMTVTAGSFTKDATGADENSTNNGSAISISGGTLTSSDTEDTSKPIQFHISGSYVNGIYAKGGEVNIANATFAFENGKNNQGVYNDGGTSRAHWCDFTIPGNNNYGIHSSITEEGAGEGEYDTTATNCTFTMTGNQNHGIYAAGGKTLASGGTYTIGSENGSGQTANFGIQVSSGSVALAGVTLDVYGEKSSCVYAVGGTISLSGENAVNMHFSSKGTTISSTAISTEGGAIEVTGGSTSVSSDALGITARQNDGNEGSISIANGAAVTVGSEDSPLHVTGVYVNGGKIENEGTLTVFSTIEDRFSWNETNKYNGVFVNGGSLVSEGTLNVTFTGVQNEESGTYLDQQIKSYAVRVETAASGGKTEVSIAGGEISNSVGGGVYVGGGTVTLGVKNGNKGPTVQTTGELLFATVTKNEGQWPWFETTYTWEGWKKVVGDSWKYMLNKSGGHAVEVSGGSLTVHGGDYTAQQGNGILIRNTSQSQATNTVKINSGSFLGYNSGYYIDYGHGQTPLGSDRMVGPAASYGLNVMGHGLNVTINGGTFGEAGSTGNSAASFFGTPVEGTSDEIKESRPQVAVHGGTFNANNADAISVFRFIDITFDGEVSSEVSGETDVASLSVQNDLLYTGESARGSTITIQSGTFTGTAYGIWYACGYDKLSISGDATIKGSTGLQVASAPVENGIAISGGTIEGKQDGIYYGSNGTAANGLLISGGTITGTNGSGLNLAGALYATHAVVITGGTFVGGQYGAYYGKDGGDDGVYINDGLLITDGTFTGPTSAGAGFFFGDNPWSRLWLDDYNNVVIVGGKFSSFGANDNGIKAGDVFTMHVEYNGEKQYGVDVGNGVYGNVGAGNGAVVMDLNAEIVLSTEQYT